MAWYLYNGAGATVTRPSATYTETVNAGVIAAETISTAPVIAESLAPISITVTPAVLTAVISDTTIESTESIAATQIEVNTVDGATGPDSADREFTWEFTSEFT